jgi:hypothetical protein
MNNGAENIMTEARARIIWGESPHSVRDFLVSKGVSVDAADKKLLEFELERNRELGRITRFHGCARPANFHGRFAKSLNGECTSKTTFRAVYPRNPPNLWFISRMGYR